MLPWLPGSDDALQGCASGRDAGDDISLQHCFTCLSHLSPATACIPCRTFISFIPSYARLSERVEDLVN